MLASTFKWRLDTNLDSLLENGDLGNGKEIPKYIENFDENGKVFTLGTNHKNQPVMYVQFGKHIIWAQPQATTKKCTSFPSQGGEREREKDMKIKKDRLTFTV